MKTKNFASGFTLIELLVVITIIGILAAVVLVSLDNSRQNAREASAKQSIASIKTTAEIYYNDNGGRYRVSGGGGGNSVCNTPEIDRLIDAATGILGTAFVRCARDQDEYAVEILLDTTRKFCVDSTGHADEITVAGSGSWTIGNVLGNSATACQDSVFPANSDCRCGL